MKSLTVHLFEILACSGVLLALYTVLLERRVRFVWCRRYLVAAMALAAIIPLLHIPVWAGEVLYLDPLPEALPATDAAPAPAPSPWRAATVVGALYGAGALLIVGLSLWQIARIRQLRRRGRRTRTAGYTLVRTSQRIASFSFFGSVYVWEGTPEEELPAILAHEASHIRHRHSVERMAMEALRAALWWNPFVWIAARRLTEVQEFEADSDVLCSGFDRSEYMSTIFRQLFGYSPEIANGLRDSLTKKRFKMMTTPSSGSHSLLRLATIVPVVAGLVCAFSLTTKAAEVRFNEPAVATVDLATASALLDSDEKPLILVDGQESPSLDGIDPARIASITLLKDATAVERYGERARYGVIIVTLKPENTAVTNDPDMPFITASVMPLFEGGNLRDFRAWVQSRLRYPAEAMAASIQGRVTVQFIVERDGSIEHVKSLESPAEVLAAEAIRVIRSSSGKWTPGRQKDQPVRISYILPVDFRITRNDDAAAPGQIEVKGRVVDAEGNPLKGALVVCRGTTSGVATDSDGTFTIRVAEAATLDVSLVDYKTVGIRALSEDLTVVLTKDAATTADEIVVVGYGTQKK